MKKTFTIFCIGAIALLAASCDLNLTPRGSITYAEGDPIITSQSDLDGFEVNIMAWLRGLEYSYFDYVSEIQMDCFNSTVSNGNNAGEIYRGDFTASSYYPEYCYEDCYTAIKCFNVFLEGSTDVPEGIDASTARGEAFFGRAFAYMFLARHWGKAYDSSSAETELCVPLVLEYNISERPARATVQEVYDQIKTDLDSAYVNLENVTGSARAERPSVDAVNCLYARYYLDTKDYTNAAAKAVSVINTGKYILSSDDESMEEEWLYDSGKEPILQYYASQSEGTGSHSYLYYEYMDNDGETVYVQEYYCPSQTLIDAYEANDLRFTHWFNSKLAKHGSNYYNQSGTDYYHFCKYQGNPDLLTNAQKLGTSVQAKKAFLIGEQYLIAAEAYYYGGNTTQAQTYLNALQNARGATATAASEANIKKEWLRETCGEGLRMTNLKRWGDPTLGRPFQDEAAGESLYNYTSAENLVMQAGDTRFCWPFSTYEMQTNLNLVQNPGYADMGSDDSGDEE